MANVSWKLVVSTPEKMIYAKEDLLAEVDMTTEKARVKQIRSPKSIIKEVDQELQSIVNDLNKGKTSSTTKLEKDSKLLVDSTPVAEGSHLGVAHEPTEKVARLAKKIGSMKY